MSHRKVSPTLSTTLEQKEGEKNKERKENLISTATKFYKCFLIGSNEIQLKSARYVSVQSKANFARHFADLIIIHV